MLNFIKPYYYKNSTVILACNFSRLTSPFRTARIFGKPTDNQTIDMVSKMPKNVINHRDILHFPYFLHIVIAYSVI